MNKGRNEILVLFLVGSENVRINFGIILVYLSLIEPKLYYLL